MKESCPALRIIYLSRSMLPSRAANSVHVMKMCRALARNGHDVTLVASKARQCPAESIYGYYGVEPVFKLAALGGRSDRVPGLLLYLINCLLYPFYLIPLCWMRGEIISRSLTLNNGISREIG